ncbi:MAG: archease [Candidatus Parvarchaeota archaeon]|jgi:SHS2 domain-containing protein|nr:archease [Candidatus Parvarchaeota archaeon]
MGYKFLENLSIADVAFEVHGDNLEEVLEYAADALANTMIKNPTAINTRITREFEVTSKDLDLLLIRFLDRLIFYKDTEQLIFGNVDVKVENRLDSWTAYCTAKGEKLDPARHQFVVDVKAATMHLLKVQNKGGEWSARVVLDI